MRYAEGLCLTLQVDNPSMRWQMTLYKEMAGKAEDADAPDKVVKRVQEVSAVLYHLELVGSTLTHTQTQTKTQTHSHATCTHKRAHKHTHTHTPKKTHLNILKNKSLFPTFLSVFILSIKAHKALLNSFTFKVLPQHPLSKTQHS